MSNGVSISVLVPIYNVEKYLAQCLDSLHAQTLSDIEFICINDGSTDSSRDILQEYLDNDDRFRVIDKPNSGYGASMNRGLDTARGEYIGIVESDDFVSPTAFEELFRATGDGSVDIVKAQYFEYDGVSERQVDPFSNFEKGSVFSPRKRPEILMCTPTIWAALYRRQMLVKAGVRFLETPGALFQDTSFVLSSWMAARSAVILDRAYLRYRINRDESSVKSDSKVYEVCGEFAAAEKFASRGLLRKRAFMDHLLAQKFSTYRWNYERISDAYHAEFAQRWAAEFEESFRMGRLRRACFLPGDWELLEELEADPVLFAKVH